MSLLSQFGDLGSIGASKRVLYRSVFLGFGIELNGYAYSTSFSIDPASRYIAQRLDDADLITGGAKVEFAWFDLATGVTEYVVGATKSGVGSGAQPSLIIPQNNSILTTDPQTGSSAIRYSADKGVTWNNAGFTGNIRENANSQFRYSTGGWYDGTYSQIQTSTGTTYYTTNGTSYVASSNNFKLSPCLAGSNYSQYSGYYFSTDANTNYWYRTSAFGTDTQVAGYRLLAMSQNGRYLVRTNVTTNLAEYSNDGAASWNAFSNSPILPASYRRFVCDNDGTFWMLTKQGSCFYYDFSSSKFTSVGSLDIQGGGTSSNLSFVTFGGGSLPLCMQVQLEAATPGGTNYLSYIADFPKRVS